MPRAKKKPVAKKRAKTPARKVGRPTVMTEPLISKLLALVSGGMTMRRAVLQVGITVHPVYERSYVDEIFAERLARARRAGAQSCLDEAEDLMRSAKTPHQVAVARELGHHLRWKASKLHPEYRNTREITGPGGGPIASNITVQFVENE